MQRCTLCKADHLCLPSSLQLLHSHSDFAVAAERLYSRMKRASLTEGEHLCFLGSGREQEDQYVNMVVAKFLQKSVPYVSLARGGYLGERVPTIVIAWSRQRFD